jgi:hypothetical protein
MRAGPPSPLVRIAGGDSVAWVVFSAAFCQFLFFTLWTLDQPISDMWGFRPAQTAISVSYMLRQGAWLANIVPVFGEPWVFSQEFPFYQWCVALLTWATGAPIGGCGRLVSAFFAIAVLWPVALIAKEMRPATARRLTLLVGALWLLAPIVVFWGRTFLIETTTAFLSVGWLALYIRFLTRRSYLDFLACLVFGVLAALVKLPAFSAFIVVGFIYTCDYMWTRRHRFLKDLPALLLAGGTVVLAAAALIAWGRYTDGFLIQNPLAALLRVSRIPQWYFGTWSQRWSPLLWDWVIRTRDLPETLGRAWFIPLFGLIILGWRSRSFWWTATLLVAFLSGYVVFPALRTSNPYYLIENAILLCAAAALIIDELLQRGNYIPAYVILGVTVASQLWAFHMGDDGRALRSDLHQHPYYLAGLAVKAATPPDSVIVGFGMNWASDVPFFSERRGIIISNWYPVVTVRRMLFEQRDRWFGGRKLGAVVDCVVFGSERIDPRLQAIRDALVKELSGKTIEVTGSVYTSNASPPRCKIYLPRE